MDGLPDLQDFPLDEDSFQRLDKARPWPLRVGLPDVPGPEPLLGECALSDWFEDDFSIPFTNLPTEAATPSWRAMYDMALSQSHSIAAAPIHSLRPQWQNPAPSDVTHSSTIPLSVCPSIGPMEGPTVDQYRRGTAKSPFSTCSAHSASAFYGQAMPPQPAPVYTTANEELERQSMPANFTPLSSSSSHEVYRRHSTSATMMMHVMDRAREEYLERQYEQAHTVNLPEQFSASTKEEDEFVDMLLNSGVPALKFDQDDATSNQLKKKRRMAAVAGKGPADTFNRSKSTPVPQAQESLTESPNRGHRSHRRREKQSSLVSLVSAPHLLRSSVPGNSCRVVTGKGEFDIPRWKSNAAEDATKRLCVAIRTNDLSLSASPTVLVKYEE